MENNTGKALRWLLMLVAVILLIWLIWHSLTERPATGAATSAVSNEQPAIAADPEPASPQAATQVVAPSTDPQATSPGTLNELIAQARQHQGATTLVFDQARPVQKNAEGQYVLEPADTIAHGISAADWQNEDAGIRLEYPGMRPAMELPPVYFTGLDGVQQNVVVSATDDALIVDAAQLPRATGHYFFTVVHYNPLQRPRQRYAINISDNFNTD